MNSASISRVISSFVLIFVISACGGNAIPPTVEAISPEAAELAESVTTRLETEAQGVQVKTVSRDTASSPTSEKPLALIYKGPGSCSLDQDDAGESGYGCSEAAADVAVAAGFRYQFVGPNALSNHPTPAQVAALFGHAKVWIQPGGIAVTAFVTMSSGLRNQIVKFISSGGGYVGFCAGAFMATARIGESNTSGFGIFPGYTAPYSYTSERGDVDYAFLSTTWNGKKRAVYFEGGPYLYGQGSVAEVTAVFSTGYAAAARAAYGNGRVYISGPHPESPAIWAGEDGIVDPDGLDLDIGADMVQWASGLK